MRAGIAVLLAVAGCADVAGEQAQIAVERLKAQALQSLVSPKCGPDVQTGTCGLLHDSRSRPEFLRQFVAERCGGNGDRACVELLYADEQQALKQRYSMASSEDVAQRCQSVDCSDSLTYELQWLGSHNAQVWADFQQNVQQVEADLAERRFAAAQRRRRVARAIAAGANAFAAGMSRPAPQPYTPAAYNPVATPSGCSSDYSCGVGYRCIKGYGQAVGECMKSVNEYGTPTYNAPAPNSVGPGGQGECGFDTDCPVGFQCTKPAGNLKGYCVRQR